MGITRIVVFALVALALTLSTWLGGGIVAQWLRPWALWLALLTAEVALLVPEQRRAELLFEACRRVRRMVVPEPSVVFLPATLSGLAFLRRFSSCTAFRVGGIARQ